MKRAVGIVAAVLAAAAVATPLIGEFEGTVNRGYLDPVGVPTSCTGHTGPDVVVGKAYSDAACARQLADDAVAHGLDIAPCLPAELPLATHGAFISVAFNLGAPTFCASTMARKARAGDLAGACGEIPRWIFAKGKALPGLVRRREAERALCMRGLIR